MPNLNDTQTLLLSHAANSDHGAFYPLPSTKTSAAARAATAIAALIKRGYADERETSDPATVTRTDGDLSYGVFVTPAGLAAIGITDGDAAATCPLPPAPAAAPVLVAAAPRVIKTSMVLDLLERDGGATLAELVEATGWLPHTTRAALTGLRKRFHAIERYKRDDVTCYRITSAA